MTSSLMVGILLISLTAGFADGIQCYQCTYNGVGSQECMTLNGSIPVTSCSTSCQEKVILNNNDAVYTYSRECAVDGAISCCKNRNSQRECSSVCNNTDLCNNSPYSSSLPINSLSRCPVNGSIPCNLCLYSGGNPDTSCLDSPLSGRVGIVQCKTDNNDCTVKSMRPIADQVSVWTYERGCHPRGSLPYGRTEDSVYITWICRCNTAYCNDNVVDGAGVECHPVSPSSSQRSPTSGGVERQISTLLIAQVVAAVTAITSSIYNRS